MISEEYVGSVCEIKTLKNVLLTTGKIKTISPMEQSIEIDDEPNDMPLIPYGTPLKIGVFHAELGFHMLVGQTYLSNRRMLRAVNIIDYLEYERRRYFRLDMDAGAILTVVPSEDDGAAMVQEIPVRIKNLSMCGMLLESDVPIEATAKLGVQMVLSRAGEESLLVAMVRAEEPKNGKYAYGVEIIDLDSRTEQKLCAFLFRQQQEQIRKSREAKMRSAGGGFHDSRAGKTKR